MIFCIIPLYQIFPLLYRNLFMPYPRPIIKEKFIPKPGKLMDQVREVLRYHHYSIRTEKAYPIFAAFIINLPIFQ